MKIVFFFKYESNRALVNEHRFARLGGRLYDSNTVKGVAKGIRRLGYEDTYGRLAKKTARKGNGYDNGADGQKNWRYLSIRRDE
jgi:hypothetical protein